LHAHLVQAFSYSFDSDFEFRISFGFRISDFEFVLR